MHEIAFKFNVPLSFDMLDMLVRLSRGGGGAGGVVCEDLVALMNWKEPPSEERLSQIAQNTTTPVAPQTHEIEKKSLLSPGPASGPSPSPASKLKTPASTPRTKLRTFPSKAGTPLSEVRDPESKLKTSASYLTSSQLHSGNLGEIPTQGYRVYGVPTVRADLPAPRIKRVGDQKVSLISRCAVKPTLFIDL